MESLADHPVCEVSTRVNCISERRGRGGRGNGGERREDRGKVKEGEKREGEG